MSLVWRHQTFVISAGRPGNIVQMRKVVGDTIDLTWLVPEREFGEYARYAGPLDEIVVGGNLMDSRNKALDIAQANKTYCLQLSDDLKALRYTDSKENKERRPLELYDAVGLIREGMRSVGAHLGGVAPTDNAYFFNHPYSTNLFIVGDMVLIDPESTIRFDTGLTLKEDYDFTLQHLTTYGVVSRCNHVLASFQHRTNRGGAVAYRTESREQENIAYLKHKWPGKIVDNPRRPNEVLLKWKV